MGIEMDAIESMNMMMAIRNLDIAVDELKELVDDANYPPECPDPERWYRICSYTRVAHMAIWRDHEPVSTVRDDVIPLFQVAEDRIGKQKKQVDTNDEKDLAQNLTRYMQNVRLRKENLLNCYLKGLSTNFAWDEIEPRLKMMSSQELRKEKSDE